MDLGAECIPKRCGIRFTPPALILVYEDKERKKQRKCVMPIRNFRVSSSVGFVAQDLKLRHKVLTSVPAVTIEKMLRILQENMKGFDLETALSNVNKEFTVDSEEDLNKSSGELLLRKKQVMEQSFNKNRVKPNDPDFVYDKRVDFDQKTGEKLESGWDHEETDDFWN